MFWPFTVIKHLKEDNQILQNRILDLERALESQVGACSVLSQQLEIWQEKANTLQEKLFDVSGINKFKQPEQTTKVQIPIGKAQQTWPRQRETLEKESYWLKKQKEMASKSTEQLEKDLDIKLEEGVKENGTSSGSK